MPAVRCSGGPTLDSATASAAASAAATAADAAAALASAFVCICRSSPATCDAAAMGSEDFPQEVSALLNDQGPMTRCLFTAAPGIHPGVRLSTEELKVELLEQLGRAQSEAASFQAAAVALSADLAEYQPRGEQLPLRTNVFSQPTIFYCTQVISCFRSLSSPAFI